MIISILILLVMTLVVPSWLILSLLFFDKPTSKIEGYLTVLSYASYLWVVFFLSNWSWVGYGFRYVFLGLFAIAACQFIRPFKRLPLWIKPGKKQWANLIAFSFLLVIFIPPTIGALKAKAIPEQPISLAFPLKQGTYYIGHGGNASEVNHHYAIPAQRFALDIIKLNRWGFRAAGLYPSELNKYEIFEDDLYSPCDGVIVEVVGGLADQIPPARDRDHLAGNYVAIQTDDYLVILAHMKKDSIVVDEGNVIETGQLLGKVGNSGNTSEPHLHIHAVKGIQLENLLEGSGIPIIFNNRFLVRNALVKAA